MNELPNTEIVKSEGEFLGAKIGFLMHLKPVRSHHRIIDDRIEKYYAYVVFDFSK